MDPIHLSTILTRSPSKLVRRLRQLSSKYGGQGHTVLFALSPNFPHSKDLQDAVNGLTRFNEPASLEKVRGKIPGRTIGCLTDTFASVSFGSTKEKSSQMTNGVLSCSIGIFGSETCIPFRSTVAGREQPQVGRWHAFRKQTDGGSKGEELASAALGRMEDGGLGEVNWEDIWSRSETGNKPSSLAALPESLRTVDSSNIQTLLTLSSPHPDTLMNAFSEFLSFPSSLGLTLVAAPTHFITGRGVTLFMDGEILGDGAIGLAFLRQGTKPMTRTEFLGVKKLSGPMTITSREGNMINSLDNSNPTRLLLDALDNADMGSTQSSSLLAASFKENEQFALGVLEPNGEISRTYKITAGDPSSRGGSLSLDAPRAPEVNTVVQFLHCPSDSLLPLPSSLVPLSPQTDVSTTKKALALLTVPEPTSVDVLESENKPDNLEEERILDNTFIATSTQGFVLSRPSTIDSSSELTWPCSLPGGMAVVEWP